MYKFSIKILILISNEQARDDSDMDKITEMRLGRNLKLLQVLVQVLHLFKYT